MTLRSVLLILPFALAACTHAEPEPASPSAATTGTAAPASSAKDIDATVLTGYHWRLAEAVTASGGHRIGALFPRADPPLSLDFTDVGLSVSGGCNHVGAIYTVRSGRLNTNSLTQTLMACEPKLMQADDAISAVLAENPEIALESGATPTLTLRTAERDGKVLTFRGEPNATTRYGGPGETVFLEVAALTKPCRHPVIPDKRCLQIREIRYDSQGLKTAMGEWQNFYEGIEGYAHESGIRNVLRVKRFKRKPAPADASSAVYVLDMVVESEVVRP